MSDLPRRKSSSLTDAPRNKVEPRMMMPRMVSGASYGGDTEIKTIHKTVSGTSLDGYRKAKEEQIKQKDEVEDETTDESKSKDKNLTEDAKTETTKGEGKYISGGDLNALTDANIEGGAGAPKDIEKKDDLNANGDVTKDDKKKDAVKKNGDVKTKGEGKHISGGDLNAQTDANMEGGAGAPKDIEKKDDVNANGDVTKDDKKKDAVKKNGDVKEEATKGQSGKSSDESDTTSGSRESSVEEGGVVTNREEPTFELKKPWPHLLGEFRSRSFSDTSPRRATNKSHPAKVRHCRSYMIFPHMAGEEGTVRGRDKEYTTPLLHQSFSWMHLPHFNGADGKEDFSTVSVMALAEAQDRSGGEGAIAADADDDKKTLGCTTSDLDDSEGSETSVKEEAIHIWDREGGRTRSLSEPVPNRFDFIDAVDLDKSDKDQQRPRAMSLESYDKAKQPPSKLQFQVTLDSLDERGEDRRSVEDFPAVASGDRLASSILMLAESTDMESEEGPPHITTSYEGSDSQDEVLTRWTRHEGRIGANPARRASITSELSPIEEKPPLTSKSSRSASVLALVDEVTQDIMGRTSADSIMAASNSTFSDIETDESRHVIDPISYWRGKTTPNRMTMRRTTLATASPNEYATKIEKQAFTKISQWKDEFALKLDDVLSKGFKDKKDEKREKRKAKLFNVPMHLSQDELSTMRKNMVLELKRKSISGDLSSMLKGVDERSGLPAPTPPAPPRVTRIRASQGLKMKDIQGNLIQELKRVSVAETGDGDLIPSQLLQRLRSMHAASLQESDSAASSRESIRVPSRISYRPPTSPPITPADLGRVVMTKDKIAELLQWHDQERERLHREMEKITGSSETQSPTQVVFQGAELEKVFRSLQVIMDSIFRETIQRFRCSDSERSDTEATESKATKTREATKSRKDVDSTEDKKTEGLMEPARSETPDVRVVELKETKDSRETGKDGRLMGRESPKPSKSAKKKKIKKGKETKRHEEVEKAELAKTVDASRDLARPEPKKLRTKIPRFTQIVRPKQLTGGDVTSVSYILHAADQESSETGSNISADHRGSSRVKQVKTDAEGTTTECGYTAGPEDTTTETPDDEENAGQNMEEQGDSDDETSDSDKEEQLEGQELEPDGASDGKGGQTKKHHHSPRPVYRHRQPVSPGHSSSSTPSSSSMPVDGRSEELQSSSSSRECGSLSFSTTLASDEMTESDSDEWDELEFPFDDDDSSECSELADLLGVPREYDAKQEPPRPHAPVPMTYEEREHERLKKLKVQLKNQRRIIQNLKHELKLVQIDREELRKEVDHLKSRCSEKEVHSGDKKREYETFSETVENLRMLLEEKKELTENKDKQIVRLLRSELEGHKSCNSQMLAVQEKLKELIKDNKVYRNENERLRTMMKVERKDMATNVELDDTDSDENETLKQQQNLEVASEKMDQLKSEMQEKEELEEILKAKEEEIAALVSNNEVRFSTIKHTLAKVESERDSLKEKVSRLESSKQETMLEIERLLRRRNSEAQALKMASQIAEATRKRSYELDVIKESDADELKQDSTGKGEAVALDAAFMDIKVSELQSKLQEKEKLEAELEVKESELVALREQEDKTSNLVNKLLKQREKDAETLYISKKEVADLERNLKNQEELEKQLKEKDDELVAIKEQENKRVNVIKEILKQREKDAETLYISKKEVADLERNLKKQEDLEKELKEKDDELVAMKEQENERVNVIKEILKRRDTDADAIDVASVKIVELERAMKGNAKREAELRTKCEELAALKGEAEKCNNDMRRALSELEQERDSLKKEIAKKVDLSKDKISQMEQLLKRRGTEVEVLTDEKKKETLDFLSNIALLNEEKENFAARVGNLEDTLQKSKQEFDSQLAIEHSELEARTREFEQFEKEIAKKEDEICTVKKSETCLREKMTELELKSQDFEQQREEQEEEISKSKDSAKQLIRDKEKEIFELNTSLSVLQGLVQKLSKENDLCQQGIEENEQLKQMIGNMRADYESELRKLSNVAKSDHHTMEVALKDVTSRHQETTERLAETSITLDEVSEMANEKLKKQERELSTAKGYVDELKEQNANLKAILSQRDEYQEAELLIQITELQSKLSQRDKEVIDLRKREQENIAMAETKTYFGDSPRQPDRYEEGSIFGNVIGSKACYGDREFISVMEGTGDRYRSIQNRIRDWKEETEAHQIELDNLLKSSSFPAGTVTSDTSPIKQEIEAATQIREDLAELKVTMEELIRGRGQSSQVSPTPDMTAMKLELKEKEVDRLKEMHAQMLEMKERSHVELVQAKNRVIQDLKDSRDAALRKAQENDMDAFQKSLKEAVTLEIGQHSEKLKTYLQNVIKKQQIDEGTVTVMNDSLKMSEATMKRLEETTVKTLSSVSTELEELKEYTFEMADVIEKDVFTSQEKLAEMVKYSSEDLTKAMHEDINEIKDLVSDSLRDYETLTAEALETQDSVGLARWNDLQVMLDRASRRSSVEIEQARLDVVTAAEAVANTALELKAVKNTVLSELTKERAQVTSLGRNKDEGSVATKEAQSARQCAAQKLDAALMLKSMEHEFTNKARLYGSDLLKKEQRLLEMTQNLGRSTTSSAFTRTPDFELSRSLGTPTAASTMLPQQHSPNLSDAADRTNLEMSRLRQTIRNQSRMTAAELESTRSASARREQRGKKLEEELKELRGRYQYLPSREVDRSAFRERIKARVATKAAGNIGGALTSVASTQTPAITRPTPRIEAWGVAHLPSRESPRRSTDQ